MKLTILNEPDSAPWFDTINGQSMYVLSNYNPCNHPDPDDNKIKRNQERFYIYVPDTQSALNGLQSGLRIRMHRVAGPRMGDPAGRFMADSIRCDGHPVQEINPEKKRFA